MAIFIVCRWNKEPHAVWIVGDQKGPEFLFHTKKAPAIFHFNNQHFQYNSTCQRINIPWSAVGGFTGPEISDK